jgi:hypothetical protein
MREDVRMDGEMNKTSEEILFILKRDGGIACNLFSQIIL